jgi:hypothetical protein
VVAVPVIRVPVVQAAEAAPEPPHAVPALQDLLQVREDKLGTDITSIITML